MIRSMTMPVVISETTVQMLAVHVGHVEMAEVGRSRGVSNATGVAVERDPERCERAPSGAKLQGLVLFFGPFWSIEIQAPFMP